MRRRAAAKYVLPAVVGRDPAANLALFLLVNVGRVTGAWRGPLKASDQRALFGSYIGKGMITISGADERLVHIVKVCFGMDFDVTYDKPWRELPMMKG